MAFRSHLPRLQECISDADSEVLVSRQLLSTLLGNRELLLASVLAGEKAWRIECAKLFRGLRFTDDMIMSMFRYIQARSGQNPVYEYEQLQMKREERENRERAEALALKELYALAHGKNREEEEQKILKAMPAPESARLPEIQKA